MLVLRLIQCENTDFTVKLFGQGTLFLENNTKIIAVVIAKPA